MLVNGVDFEQQADSFYTAFLHVTDDCVVPLCLECKGDRWCVRQFYSVEGLLPDALPDNDWEVGTAETPEGALAMVARHVCNSIDAADDARARTRKLHRALTNKQPAAK